MKTRNQVVTSAKNKVAPETANAAANQSGKNELARSLSSRSPSPLRLRERKPLSMERKSQPGPTLVDKHLQDSTAHAKRSLIGPTRLLRQRSSSKPTSLLAPGPRNKVSSSVNNSFSRSGTIIGKSFEPTSSKKDTHQNVAGLSDEQEEGKCPNEHGSAASDKTANVKNYSRDIPSTKASIPPNQIASDNELVPGIEVQPVRISLPDNVQDQVSDVSDDSFNRTSNLNSCGRNGRAIINNGLKNDNIDDSESDISQSGDNTHSTSNTERGLLNGAGTSNTNQKIIFNVLIGVTGSVATIKLIELILKLKSMFPRSYTSRSRGDIIEASLAIKIIMTNNSKHFISKDDLIEKTTTDNYSIEIYDDSDEWGMWKKMGDPVLHIDLRKWADLCLIAPLDANTMAKLANGICDNLLTCVVRAWDISKPLIYCPAMNVHMFNHPITRDQLSKLQSFGYMRVDCVEKRLACGDFGIGGMATVDSIANKVIDCLMNSTQGSASLSRPLLNQQPTYPIISTSDRTQDSHSNDKRIPSSSISTHQLLNRFRTNNQITIHAVSNNSTKPRPGSRVDEIASLALKRRRILNSSSSVYPYSTSGHGKNPNKPYSYQNHLLGHNNNKQKMGGVTSVQNLKAMGLDESLLNCTVDASYAANGNDNDVDYQTYFDPSKVLEQSMTIDDSIAFPNHTNGNTNPSQTIERNFLSSHRNEDGLLQLDSLTPFFNTSKFLALCQNKERGCFTCAICKHDYKNRKSMARHLKEQHVQGNIFHCKPCNVSYKRREKLIKHNRERHGIV